MCQSFQLNQPSRCLNCNTIFPVTSSLSSAFTVFHKCLRVVKVHLSINDWKGCKLKKIIHGLSRMELQQRQVKQGPAILLPSNVFQLQHVFCLPPEFLPVGHAWTPSTLFKTNDQWFYSELPLDGHKPLVSTASFFWLLLLELGSTGKSKALPGPVQHPHQSICQTHTQQLTPNDK